MKKLFTFIFMLSAMCALVYAEDFVFDKEAVKQEIDSVIKTELADGGKAVRAKEIKGVVQVIRFNQDIVTRGNKNVSNPNKECIAVVIDDEWAVASKKCRLAKGDKLGDIPGTVDSSSSYNFRIIIGSKEVPVKSYELDNVFLLRAQNFKFNDKANLVLTSDLSALMDSFKDGKFEVDRTNKHRAAYEGQHATYENISSYYGVGRKTYEKDIESVYKDNKTDNMLAQVSSTLFYPKLLRAGDPLFFVKDGQKYLLGFGNAVNLWDNFDGTRTDKVILLKNTRLIWEKINSVDPKAAKRIHDNLLVK